jgi:Tfp pilus assembly protein PilO
MEQKKIILIVSGLIVLVAAGVVYFLVLPANNQLKLQSAQVEQLKEQIESKQNYYSVIEAKLKALEDAGWADKEKMIALNFTISPFYVPKMNAFFRTVAAGSGVTISSISSSPATTAKTVAQAPAASGNETVKISKETAKEETAGQQQQPVATTYLDQLQGSVQKTTFNMTVTGTYSSFKKFLSDLESQTRIVTVKSISVSSSQAAGTGKKAVNVSNFNLVVDAYSY